MRTYTINRSKIMKRAWQLKSAGVDLALGECIRAAWAEAKTARKTIERLEMNILCLEMKDRWNEFDYKDMAHMRSALSNANQVASALSVSMA